MVCSYMDDTGSSRAELEESFCTNIFDGDGKLSKSLPTGKDAIDGELVMLLVRELKNFGP